MNIFFGEARQTLFPHGEKQHGPLPPMLVAMTMVTGLIDAFSFLVLGHIFVANMTGNVVFLAFAAAGASGFSIPASLVALGSFILGALGSGLLGSHLEQHRGRLLTVTAGLQTLLLGLSAVLVSLSGNTMPEGYKYGLIIFLGIAMGLQNATARKLAVPDLTTTVLTLTIVGIAADSRLVGGIGSRAGRCLISVVAMFIGSFLGSLLILRGSIIAPLVIALIVMAMIALLAQVLARKDPVWLYPPGPSKRE